MPQLNKGGKFVFGWSKITDDFEITIPSQAIQEYDIVSEGRVILISGSKTTEGIIVSRLSLIKNSIFSNIFLRYPNFKNYSTKELELLPYKGRLYTWAYITPEGKLKLNNTIMEKLNLKIGSQLMSIRSSNIAFTMGAYGPLIKKGNEFPEEILKY